MGLLDEALNYHRNSRLGRLVALSEAHGETYLTFEIAKLTDAILRPAESKIQRCMAQVELEIKKLEDLKNVAHEAQTADIQSIVTQTGQDLSALSNDFHKVSVTLGFGMEFLHNRLLNVESTVSQIQTHGMARYTQELHDALLSSSSAQYWDTDEALMRLASYDFRLSPKDHWDNNGILSELLAWSHDPGHGPVLWIGGSSGNQDTWVTELSVDIVQALRPQLPTVVYVFCNELAETSSALTPAALMRILVGQLLELHPELAYNDAVYYSTSRMRNATTFWGIWRVFERLVADISNVFIVIDRIEECVVDDDADLKGDLLPALSALLGRIPGARAIITSIYEPPEEDLLERTRDWDAAVQLAQDLVSQLTLDEKVEMITGNASAGNCIGNIAPIPRVNFTGLCMLDGPAAVNRADLISVFPSGIAAAATWDRDLIYRRGYALGEEFKGKGGHVMLGPCTGPMGRHPLGGRNWEGFGPDPYLAGIATEESIHGVQDAGVQTSTKHYIANEQETQRSSTINADGTRTEGISSNVDDRTVHELYLWPFANAVKAGSSSLMCSYQRVNQQYSCENSYLLQTLLRDELGFKGYVVSDWYATHSTAKSINAGLDLEMPGYVPTGDASSELWFGQNVLSAIHNGSVTETRVDEMIRNILTPYYYLGQDATDFPTPEDALRYVLLIQEASLDFGREAGLIPDNFVFPRGRDVRGDHAKVIREMGAAGTVLLKNVNNTLPLKDPKVIGVFGNDAGDFTNGFFRPSEVPESVNTGTMIIGGGSGSARPPYVVSPLDAIKAKAKETDAQVFYVTHNEVLAGNDFRGIYPPPELCLVFQQTFASESFDRTSFELDGNSTAVINNVADFCGNTVVVTHSGGVNTMLPWANNTKVGAILAAHYPGQESGSSIVDVLWGDVAPSGRLPYTLPRSAADAGPAVVNLTQPVADPLAWQANFTEGQLIDYRHYDAEGIEPLYEFGFGLTYTTFTLDGDSTSVSLATGSVADRPDSSVPVQPGGHPQLWEDVVVVKTRVTNTGDRAAHAVPQLYLSFPDTAPEGTPVKVLRGFEKVPLEAGASADVEFRLQRRDVSYWDTTDQTWVIPSAEFVFMVGFSSRDLPVEKTLAVLPGAKGLEGLENRFVVN
ncbi:hypothetical protein diail_4289 [Diaporthe ilicicola]|nr:hypothetical protein diail_4289 [Diaporthe ilicicola]